MNYFRTIDFLHKSLSSILFRLLLITYSFFLIYIHENMFEIIFYIVVGISYFLFYVFLLLKNKHLLRTFNDYLFILFVLIGKNILSIEVFLLLLFPIFNSPNHTGNKRSSLLLFLLTLVVFFLVSLSSNNFNILTFIYIAIGLFSFTLITYFELIRINIFHKVFNIYKEIDDLISKKSNSSQIPDVYRLIIQKFLELANIQIERIICFQKKNNTTYLVNSSSFVYYHDINLKKITIDGVRFNEFDVKVNEKNLICILIIPMNKYTFVCLVDENNKNNLSLKNKIYLLDIGYMLFEKLTKIIDQELNLNKEKNKHVEKLADKQNYVLEVMNSTHFFSNKLSSIKNFIQASEDYDNGKFQNVEQKAIKALIKKERKKSKAALENIVDKIDRLLNKESNPFIPTTVKDLKYKYIFMIVKKLWTDEYSEDTIKFKNIEETNFNKKIKSNDEIIEFILIDLITNMKKYSNDYKEIEFDFQEPLTITIRNTIKNYSAQKDVLKKTVDSFNNNQRMEINRRNNFGLAHIKDLSIQLNIQVILEINDESELFVTKLIFKGGESEVINI